MFSVRLGQSDQLMYTDASEGARLARRTLASPFASGSLNPSSLVRTRTERIRVTLNGNTYPMSAVPLVPPPCPPNEVVFVPS